MIAPAQATTRVCVIAEGMAERPDEGGRGFAAQLTRALSEICEVRSLSLTKQASGLGPGSGPSRTFLTREIRRRISETHPDIVVYLPSASLTLFSILRARVLATYARQAQIALVVHQPRAHGLLARRAIRLAKPDLIFSQDPEMVEYARSLSCRAEVLPPAVDVQRFHPVQGVEKRELRRRYGFPEGRPVVLHVGHLKEERNLTALTNLTQFAHVVVVAGSSTGVDRSILLRLEQAGVQVVQGFLPAIEEIYQASDCYVFPVQSEEGAIAMPLSVLEAMATNLPVISTRFGALPAFFSSGNGLRLVDGDEEIAAAVRELNNLENVATRDLVMPFSWRRLAECLLERMAA